MAGASSAAASSMLFLKAATASATACPHGCRRTRSTRPGCPSPHAHRLRRAVVVFSLIALGRVLIPKFCGKRRIVGEGGGECMRQREPLVAVIEGRVIGQLADDCRQRHKINCVQVVRRCRHREGIARRVAVSRVRLDDRRRQFQEPRDLFLGQRRQFVPRRQAFRKWRCIVAGIPLVRQACIFAQPVRDGLLTAAEDCVFSAAR